MTMARYKKILLALTNHLKIHRDIHMGVVQYIESVNRNWDLMAPQKFKPLETYRWIRNWEIDGVIGPTGSLDEIQAVQELSTPFVSISSGNLDSGIEIPFPIVQQDDWAVGRMAAEYLLEQGFRNIAFYYWGFILDNNPRGQGFIKTLTKNGVTPEIVNTRGNQWMNNSSSPGWRMLRKIPKPAAIFGFDDSRAENVHRACRHMGISIPEQVAILGVTNDENICFTRRPHLSSIELDGRKIGLKAAKTLDSLMRGRKPPARPALIPPTEVIVRQSSDIIAIDDPLIAKAVRYIREKACVPIGLTDVVNCVPVGRETLAKRFKKAMGRTIFQEIRRVQIHRVNLLLRTTDMSLDKIAAETGFEDGIALSHAYRTFTKSPPGAYRKDHRKHMLR